MPGGSGMGIGKIDYLGESSKSARLRAATFRRIGHYFRPYRSLIALIFLCLLLGALAGQVTPLAMRAILDKALPRHDSRLLLVLAAALVAFPLLEGLFTVAQQYFNAQITQSVMRDLRVQLFQHLNQMSLRFFTATKTGEIISRLNNDVAGVHDVVSKIFVNAVSNGLVVVVTAAIMFSLDAKLALLSLAALPLFVLPVRRVGRFRQRLRRRAQEHYAELNHLLQESFGISGAILMRVFGHERMEEERLAAAADQVRQLEIRISVSGRWFAMFVTLAAPVSAALLFWYGGLAVMRGALSVGTVIAFTAYLARLYSPFSQLVNLHIDLLTATALFERVFEYLDLKPEIMDRPAARVLTTLTGHVRFERVSFAYPGHAPVLHEVSFDVAPGESVALVGPSGAGKTTLTYLLLRFYDPTEGRVRLDDWDIRDLTVRSLRAQVGIATQEPFLFHATVRENLRYARADAGEADLIAACRAAYIHDRIEALPDGYDTVVGERGYKLSGGEKQRLALARVFLKNPRILILDEATSSVDAQSEAYIQSALERLRQGRTTLIIAHRLSTVQAADKIVVLQAGRVVEQGTHTELLARHGVYAQLYPKR